MVKFLNTIPLPSRICWGGMNIFFDPPLSMKYFNDGGGSFFLQVFTNQTYKVDSVYNHSSNKKKVYIFW